jgi:hydrogenase maturation protein HypF
MAADPECLTISVKGIVQGVGFRPFVYNLARELKVNGFITNTADGVLIEAEGGDLGLFLERMRRESPPLSKIVSVDVSSRQCAGHEGFSIRESSGIGSFTLISPDVSVCPDCMKELFDPKDRRYLYPFINCTNCGPRYSITRSVPYDRANTTMQVFAMCGDCESEYHDPGDRRFHAQPNACHRCGPRVELRVVMEGIKADEGDAVSGAINLLKRGYLVAIRGLGGFHIACDASNVRSVGNLRERKRKNNKPFALMAPDVEAVRKFCIVSDDEEELLLSRNSPIVLLEKKGDAALPSAVAPGNKRVGFMLPYTPLHHLLFRRPLSDDVMAAPHFDALVMTSGNVSEEPIVTDNKEALARLSDIADAFLFHDREIFMRVDDSVVRVNDGNFGAATPPGGWSLRPERRFFVRRSRGFVPEPIPLYDDGPEVLGCGADLKNTFTLTKGRYAIPSQHIGDMENFETLSFFQETLRNLKSVYRASPVAVAYDPHPAYMSSGWAKGRDEMEKVPVQHHYAHIASVMAENGIKEKVIGVAFDGTGYGDDGTLWGGEFLVADLQGYKRAAHIRPVPLPGGERAVKEPWRTSLSYLQAAAGEQIWEYLPPTGFVEKFGREKIGVVLKIAEAREFSPLSSGAGRLFDAVSAILSVCDTNTFEGEAAMALESLVRENVEDDYAVDISFKEVMEIDFGLAVLGIVQDLERSVDKGVIASKFHNTVAVAIVRTVAKLSLMHNLKKAVLSGGVFQNAYLLNRVETLLRADGMQVFVNEIVPCNDAGISLGQAYVLRERLMTGRGKEWSGAHSEREPIRGR